MNHPIHDDGQLLARFIDRRDELAFETLVQRHAPLVFNVCRRVLGASPDVEDAAQAVFLVLAQKAPALRREPSLATWLHGVAFNVARRARTAAVVRSEKEAHAVADRSDFSNDGAWRAVEPLLDGELDELPEKYRTPLVLHHLQGLTEEEIARVLACPVGTVSTQLSRGRSLLRERLTRRGLALTAVAFAGCLSAGRAAAAEVPAGFTAAACSSAKALTIGQPLPAQAQRAGEWAKNYRDLMTASAPARAGLTGTVALAAAVMLALAAGILTQSMTRTSAVESEAHVVPEPIEAPAAQATITKADPVAAPVPVVPPKEADVPAEPAALESDDAKVARWVKELIGPDEKLRLAASESLRIGGAPAQAALEAAARGEDQALAEAAKGVLERIKADALLDRMISEVGRAESFQADMSMETNLPLFGFATKGTFKCTPDGKFLADQEIKISGLAGMVKSPEMSSVRMIGDGEALWTIAETDGKPKVAKIAAYPADMKTSLTKGPLGQIEQLRQSYEFLRVQEGTLDGKQVYILEGEMKKQDLESRMVALKEEMAKCEAEKGSGKESAQAKGGEEVRNELVVRLDASPAPTVSCLEVGKVEIGAGERDPNSEKDQAAAIFNSISDLSTARVYIDKETSYVLKSETLNSKGEVVLSMRITNVKIGEKLDPKLFQYQPPEGVKVEEVTIPNFALGGGSGACNPVTPPKENEGFGRGGISSRPAAPRKGAAGFIFPVRKPSQAALITVGAGW